MARYMARNLGHIHLPPPLIDRLQSAPDKPRESVAIAAEVVRRVRDDGYAGVLLATIGWEHLLPEILERI
jgi:5,10-methylenetetrahydrofolate reductase